MGKEKSQFSKILIESIHRWNRSQISMRAPPDHFDPFDVFGWDCPVDIDMRESDIRTPTVYEIQRQYARVARLINRAERGEVALPYTISDLNEARQLFLQRRGNRNTMYDVSERPQQGRYHTRTWNPNADTSDSPTGIVSNSQTLPPMESEWLTNWICHSNTSSYVPIYGSTERLNLRNTPLVIAGDVAPSPPMTPRPPMFPGEPASRMASRPHLTSLELDVNDATEAAAKLTYHVALGKSAEQAAA